MSPIASLSAFLEQTGTTLKVIIGAGAMIAALTASYVAGKSIVDLPSAIAQHDSTTKVGNQVMEKMLCITIADHRRMDWHLCYINPNEVLPIDPKR